MKNTRNRLIAAIVTLPFIFIHLASAAAGSLGAPYELEARTSAQKISSRADSWNEVAALIGLWQAKCGKTESRATCYLTECEVSPSDCRASHALLFRGESHRYELPATSGLTRSRWTGSSYAAETDAQGLLRVLSDDVQQMGPVGFAPQSDALYLIKNKSAEKWVYETGVVFSDRMDAHHPLNFRQFIFAAHAEASPLYYRDPILNKDIELDPLISFSESPATADEFSRRALAPNLGRLIAISVPVEKLSDLCSLTLPEPGEIIQSRKCGDNLEEYSDEREYDSFLYVKPEYIWKSYLPVTP